MTTTRDLIRRLADDLEGITEELVIPEYAHTEKERTDASLALVAEARAFLAQPEPEEPTDSELVALTVCYAIASGEYSDYRVCAIFTTKEKAKAELFKYGSEAFIEEFPLDPVTPEWPTGFGFFRCFGGSSGQAFAHMADLSKYESSYFQVRRESPTGYSVYVIAKDKEHAVKIAAEKFAKADAIQSGIAL